MKIVSLITSVSDDFFSQRVVFYDVQSDLLLQGYCQCADHMFALKGMQMYILLNSPINFECNCILCCLFYQLVTTKLTASYWGKIMS